MTNLGVVDVAFMGGPMNGKVMGMENPPLHVVVDVLVSNDGNEIVDRDIPIVTEKVIYTREVSSLDDGPLYVYVVD